MRNFNWAEALENFIIGFAVLFAIGFVLSFLFAATTFFIELGLTAFIMGIIVIVAAVLLCWLVGKIVNR